MYYVALSPTLGREHLDIKTCAILDLKIACNCKLLSIDVTNVLLIPWVGHGLLARCTRRATKNAYHYLYCGKSFSLLE